MEITAQSQIGLAVDQQLTIAEGGERLCTGGNRDSHGGNDRGYAG
jgi:hypothetical protein